MSTTEEFDWGSMTPVEATPDDEGQLVADDATQDEPAAATATERPRDPETGQFLPKETAEDAGERLLAGKYKSAEALEQGYLEAQQLLGSLRSDQGELRSQLEQLTYAVQQGQQQPAVQDFEALLQSDPQKAALYALTVGDQGAYNRAKEEWNELSPGTPAVWEQNMQMQHQLQELESRLSGVAAPVVEQQNLRVVADAYRSLVQSIPDFEQLAGLRSEVAVELASSGYDWATPALESGDRGKIETALKSLTDLARARASGNLVEQARIAAEQHVASTEQAKREAIVGSASSSMSEPPSRTPGQALAQSWAAYDISALRDS